MLAAHRVLGLAHRVTEDDVYRGLLIKKGTTIYANIWSVFCHVFDCH